MASKKMTPMAAQKVVKKAVATKKAAATKKTPTTGTGQSGYGGKVTPAVLAQIKKDGMDKALLKAATYRSSNAYLEGVFRMYGKQKFKAVQNSPAAQKILGTPGKGGKNPDGMPEAFIKGTVKAVKNIPNIPGAGVKAIKKKITGK